MTSQGYFLDLIIESPSTLIIEHAFFSVNRICTYANYSYILVLRETYPQHIVDTVHNICIIYELYYLYFTWTKKESLLALSLSRLLHILGWIDCTSTNSDFEVKMVPC